MTQPTPRSAPRWLSSPAARAGGTPGLIRTNLVSDFRGIEYQPIEFTMAGLTRRAAVPGVFAFEVEGVASRNRSGEPYYIDNTAHPAKPAPRAGPAPKTCMCTASGSIWIWPARAITGITRRSPWTN